MDRRLFVATVATCCVGATAGCLDQILDDATSFSAAPAIVSDDSVTEAEYEYQGTEEIVHEHDVAGRSVETTNYASTYSRSIEIPLDVVDGETEAGVFGIVSTPQITVGGETFNPVAEMSHAEIADHAQDQYEEISLEDDTSGQRPVEMLGESVSVDTFEGDATVFGVDGVDVFLDVAQRDHDGDHLVIAGAYPDAGGIEAEAEARRIDALIDGVEHGEDVLIELTDDAEPDPDG
ncbi:DUF6517 family protein [Natrarchaeobius chitinivorans]|uniref:Uncharacterized protein n=1 Tax=Natrarchaeobius chitinivorans TaxID=1679083 RepID=A0A3N6M4Q4_NATCH|nr:DUF6517 family protein [Natrarchaeobius chitinivorans]RQG96997.1 hypothetical protein EA473_02645 [Natrarchaeobius chitinivorans]